MDSTVRVIFLGDSSSAVRAVGGLEGRMGTLGSTAARTGKMVAGAFGITLAAGIVKATSLAIGFDRSMRNVNSLAKLNERQFASLSKQVLALGKVSGQAPKVLADGLYDIVSSGYKAGEALKILKVSAIAATAGQTDTATASKAVVAVLNAYGLTADKAKNVSSLLFKQVQLGVNTFEELAQNLGDTVPLASQLKIPFSQVAAGLAEITKHGTSMAEASTQVSRVMTDILKPSKSLSAQLKSMGYETGEAAIKAHGFAPLIGELSKAAGGSADKFGSWFGNVRSLRGILNLTGPHLKEFNSFVKQMGKSMRDGGDDTKAFNEQSKSISVQWDKATAALSGAAIKLGTQLFPVLETGITKLSDFAGWLDVLARKPNIHAKVDFLISTGQGLLGDAQKVVDHALHGTHNVRAQVGPVGDLRYDPGMVQQLTKSIQQGIEGANWTQIGQSITQRISDATSKQAHGHDWGDLARTYVGGLADSITQVREEGSRDIGRTIGEMLRAGVQRASQISVGDVKSALKGTPRLIAAAFESLLAEGIGSATGIVEGITGRRFKGSVRDLIASIPGIIRGGLDGAHQAATEIADRIVAGIKTAPGKLAGLAGDLGKMIGPALSQVAGQAYTWALGIGKQIAQGVLDGAGDLASKVTSALGFGKHPKTKNPVPTGHAQGGVIDRPMLSMIGEDAPRYAEFIIPTNPAYRDRAMGLLGAANKALGVPGFAKGGGPKPGSGHHYFGHQIRKPNAVSVKGVTGAAAAALTKLTTAQQVVADLSRSYDQDAREQGTVSLPPLTTDVLDDPADPTGSTHQVLNPAGISAAVAQLTQLVNEKGGILKALDDEKQRVEDAIAAVKAAIDALVKAIAELQAKAKAAGVEARRQHGLASQSSLTVSRKGGLQDQVTAERAKKKPSKARIAALEAQIKQAGRDHDDHEGLAKASEVAQGRFQKQAENDASRLGDLRGSLGDLMTTRHDLPFDVRDQQIDVEDLQKQIRDVTNTSVSPFSPSTTPTTTTSSGSDSTDTSAIVADLQARLLQYATAMGMQGRQLDVLGGMPSFSKGSTYIPNDMIAQLHAGETIRNADQTASDIRSAGGGGGPIAVHIYGAAVTDHIQAFVEQNGQMIAATVNTIQGRSADMLRRSNRTA